MVKKNYLADAYVAGLTESEREFMGVYNLKELSDRLEISYHLLRKAVKGERIPRSVYEDIVNFIKKSRD